MRISRSWTTTERGEPPSVRGGPAGLDCLCDPAHHVAPGGAAPTRPRRPRRPGMGVRDVVPSAHTDDVAAPDAAIAAARVTPTPPTTPTATTPAPRQATTVPAGRRRSSSRTARSAPPSRQPTAIASSPTSAGPGGRSAPRPADRRRGRSRHRPSGPRLPRRRDEGRRDPPGRHRPLVRREPRPRARARSSRRSEASTPCSASSASCRIGPPTSTRSPATPSPCPMSIWPARAPVCASLGPDVVPGLVLDRDALAAGRRPPTTRACRRRRARRCGPPRRRTGAPPGAAGVRLLDDMLETPSSCSSLLRSEIADGERTVVELTNHQIAALKRLSRIRRHAGRSARPGPARRCSPPRRPRRSPGGLRDPPRLLQPAARAPARRDLTADTAASAGRLTVSTFHQLCEDLAREAGILPPKPEPVTAGLVRRDAAATRSTPRSRSSAGGSTRSSIDEGQDFARGLADARSSAPARGLARGRPVRLPRSRPGDLPRRRRRASSGSTTYALDENCRNPGPIHAFAMSHAPDAPDDDRAARGRPVASS